MSPDASASQARHLRITFQEELEELATGLQTEGELVLRSLRAAVEATCGQDAELADEVIAFDDDIDDLYLGIHQGVEQLLARQTPVASDLVKSPRVGESPIAMECRLYREIELGDSVLVVGEIVRAHVSEDVLVDGRVDALRLLPVARLGGDQYTIVREVERRARPKVEGAGSAGGGR